MTTEKKSVFVDGVEVKHPVERYMQHYTGFVVAVDDYEHGSGTNLSSMNKEYLEADGSGWNWNIVPYQWFDVTKEWRAKEKHAYTQKHEPKTPVQESEPTLSVLDEVALKLLPMVYQIADGDGSMYRHENWPVGLAQEAYRLAEAFMEVKLARDNKPVDTE